MVGDRTSSGSPATAGQNPAGQRPGDASEALTAALSCVPMETFQFAIGGRMWAVRAGRDQSALLAVSDRFAVFPFGLLLWESSSVLAGALADRSEIVRDRRVLELGAGVGLAGIVARWLGAASVRQTDHIAEALQLCAANAAANGVDGIDLMLADWTAWADDAAYDLIIGSDVLYDRAAHAPFAAILKRNLSAGGRVLLTDPGRQDTPRFLDEMAASGWHVTRTIRSTPALLQGGPDHVEVAVIDLVR